MAVKTQSGYRRKIISDMKTLGIYKPEYEQVIKSMAGARVCLDETIEEWTELGKPKTYEYTNKGGAVNIVKHPLYVIVNELQREVLGYGDALGLTPRGLKRIVGEKSMTAAKPEVSKLAAMLRENE